MVMHVRFMYMNIEKASWKLVSCPVNKPTKSGEFVEDGVGGRSPHEGLRMHVVVGDEVFDLAHQVRHRGEGVATDGLLGNQAEPAFDLVEP